MRVKKIKEYICPHCGSKVRVTYQPYPTYADVMPIEEFAEHVANKSLIDYDGHGYYGYENAESNIRMRPSDFQANLGFTHVGWYNR